MIGYYQVCAIVNGDEFYSDQFMETLGDKLFPSLESVSQWFPYMKTILVLDEQIPAMFECAEGHWAELPWESESLARFSQVHRNMLVEDMSSISKSNRMILQLLLDDSNPDVRRLAEETLQSVE